MKDARLKPLWLVNPEDYCDYILQYWGDREREGHVNVAAISEVIIELMNQVTVRGPHVGVAVSEALRLLMSLVDKPRADSTRDVKTLSKKETRDVMLDLIYAVL
ncbi:MAG TPA: hypothetical protein VKK79_11775 [Candidatus Lokiarchaeia archaeon]|nr:hypothetical protein [Candidatus Lokiarchaeia archaeon]